MTGTPTDFYLTASGTMKAVPKRWTQEEDAFLIDQLPMMSVGEIAQALGRTYRSVNRAMIRLDVTKRPKRRRFPEAGPGKRFCLDCGLEKSLGDFGRHSNRASGYLERCRSCRAGRQITDLYGLSTDDYEEMLRRQGGVCASCRGPETNTYRGVVRRLAVDHNHVTGQVRGLLCSDCNRMIGVAHEDPDRLVAGAAYLLAWV